MAKPRKKREEKHVPTHPAMLRLAQELWAAPRDACECGASAVIQAADDGRWYCSNLAHHALKPTPQGR